MIIMTFDEFDKLSLRAEEEIVGDSYKFPTLEEITHNLTGDENNVFDVLVAYYNTTDKEYRRRVNQLLTDYVYLTEEIENTDNKLEQIKKMRFTPQELQSMVNQVSDLNFQCSYWYPSVHELNEWDFKPTKLNVLFLLWLINTKLELTEDEEQSRSYAQKILKNLIDVEE